ncbi:hypothetical protein D0T49_09160 [Paludibacter sp. 221]|uniref:hypothetical protein n=1 Tax=Paludibacter sp. 221 TaxID=2302939 RepID=UPI0013D13953|nr:hypothetical protein [Paludibacter sp. 221]NDV47212.1 hypothetical protein [Paludibacter sp. 221]
MKKLIIFIFLSYTILSFSQNNEIEKLVNKASGIVVPKDFKYYNLLDSSFVLDVNRLINYNPLFEKFIKNNTDFKLFEFLSSFDSLEKISWSNYKIEKAHLYSYDNIPKFATHSKLVTIISYKTSKSELDSLNRIKKYNEIIVPVKKWWPKKRIEKEIDKKWDEREKNTVLENQKYFEFSTPVFSSNYKYAIIQLITGGERSMTYVFKKVDNDWIPFSAIDEYVY